MSKPLPHRPNLDHLRRQAKNLLARVRAGESESIQFLIEYLPAVNGMSAAEIVSAGLRLADMQFAIARSTGFGSWPKLTQHVELLRRLEGTWAFDSLEVDGQQVPSAHTQHSRILIDGDRFRTESPLAIYEGVFNIDAEASPPHIDIEFIAGPEAGNWNYGIFRLDGDRLEICLDMTGQPRPKEFGTAPGRGHAYEVLRRESGTAPFVRTSTGDGPESQGCDSEAMPGAPSGCGCTASVNRLVPYVHVADVEASLAFYARLGFVSVNAMKDSHGKMFWVLARSGDAEIMLVQASGPIDAEQQAVLFYMYSPDLSTLRATLIEHGLRDAGVYRGVRSPEDTTQMVHKIAHPDHMKCGEMRVIDPDGYVILVGQLA
ncbi:MAG: TIGR03067 domain-containing protein [Phycisphaerales bacterium JB065]